MVVWILIVVLLSLGVIAFLREPRRLRVGILLLSALALTALAAVGTIFDRLDDPYNESAAWLLLGMITVGLVSLVTLALFLLYNGVIMLRKESRSPANMLSLGLGVALLAYITVGFVAVAANEATLAVVILLSIPPVAYIGFVFCAFILYSLMYTRLAPLTADTPNAVIVLGAGLIGDRVTPLLAGRLRKGQQVYENLRNRNPDASIVVSGGQGPDEATSEADAMSAWLIDEGVPGADVILEPHSRNTEQNLRFSKELLGQRGIPGPVAVVTSNYHAFRAATLMRTIGIDGYSIGASTARYFWPSAMIREFIALLRDHARLNIAILVVLLAPFILFCIGRLVVLIS